MFNLKKFHFSFHCSAVTSFCLFWPVEHAFANVIPVRGTLHGSNKTNFFSFVNRKASWSSKLKSPHTAPYVVEEEPTRMSYCRVTGVKHAARRHLWSLFSFPSVCSFVNHSHHPYLLVWDECSQFHWIIGSLFNNKETLLIKERYFKKFCNRTVLWGLFFYFYGLCEQLLLIYSRCVCIYFLMTFIYNIPFVISL